MAATDTFSHSHQVLSEDEHRKQLRRAAIASTIGTTIEWYDFFSDSTVTGLVFAKLFFPKSDPLTGTLEAFAIYAVGFAARPIGAAIFGHIISLVATAMMHDYTGKDIEGDYAHEARPAA